MYQKINICMYVKYKKVMFYVFFYNYIFYFNIQT